MLAQRAASRIVQDNALRGVMRFDCGGPTGRLGGLRERHCGADRDLEHEQQRPDAALPTSRSTLQVHCGHTANLNQILKCQSRS
jgi:hypothetical protein